MESIGRELSEDREVMHSHLFQSGQHSAISKISRGSRVNMVCHITTSSRHHVLWVHMRVLPTNPVPFAFSFVRFTPRRGDRVHSMEVCESLVAKGAPRHLRLRVKKEEKKTAPLACAQARTCKAIFVRTAPKEILLSGERRLTRREPARIS